jgi:hypothetical protein
VTYVHRTALAIDVWEAAAKLCARTPTDEEQAAACAYIDILVSHQAMPDLSRIGVNEVLVLASVVVRRTMPDAMARA